MGNNVDAEREWLHLISGVMAGADVLFLRFRCCWFYFSRLSAQSDSSGGSSLSLSQDPCTIFLVRITIQDARSQLNKERGWKSLLLTCCSVRDKVTMP